MSARIGAAATRRAALGEDLIETGRHETAFCTRKGSSICFKIHSSLFKNYHWLCQPMAHYCHADGNPVILKNTDHGATQVGLTIDFQQADSGKPYRFW
jgi:hypothetical protein